MTRNNVLYLTKLFKIASYDLWRSACDSQFGTGENMLGADIDYPLLFKCCDLVSKKCY